MMRAHAPSGQCAAGQERGFAMLALLIVVALMGLALTAAATLWSTQSKREKETELLRIGAEFNRAIASYAQSSPGPAQYPRSLEDLVRDPRFPNVKRHLRRIYADPFTGKADWGLVKLGDAIVGVHSLSEDKPLKTGGFDDSVTLAPDAAHYSDWRFIYKPSDTPATSPGGSTGVPAAAAKAADGDAPPSDMGAATPPSTVRSSCQILLADTYRECAKIQDAETRSGCVREAIAAYQQCMPSNR